MKTFKELNIQEKVWAQIAIEELKRRLEETPPVNSQSLKEGKLDDFDKAYNSWVKATAKLTKTFEAAATNKDAISSFKLALSNIEKSIDKGDMRS
jgi:hypothetical protein